MARFLAYPENQDDHLYTAPAPSDLHLVRTIKHELEMSIFTLRGQSSALKRDLTVLESELAFNGPRELQAIFSDDNEFHLLSPVEREILEQEVALLRKKHRLLGYLCDLSEMRQGIRVEYYAKKSLLEKEAELHAEMEQNMARRYTSQDVREKQHEMLRKAFLSAEGTGDGDLSPTAIVKRTAPAGRQINDPGLKQLAAVLERLKNTPAFECIFTSIPKELTDIQYEADQLKLLERKLTAMITGRGVERVLSGKDSSAAATGSAEIRKSSQAMSRLSFIIEAVKSKLASLELRADETVLEETRESLGRKPTD